MQTLYANIILPLSVKRHFSYVVPEHLAQKIHAGTIVVVPFGPKKFYSGVVVSTTTENPNVKNIKSVIRIIDDIPDINDYQLKLWQWMSEYYMCSEGDVMNAAIPTVFKPRNVEEDCGNGYKPKEVPYVRLAVANDETTLNAVIDQLHKAPKQLELLMCYLQLSGIADEKKEQPVEKIVLLKKSDVSPAALDALVKKGVLSYEMVEVSRLNDSQDVVVSPNTLSDAQQKALDSIMDGFTHKNVMLLHGVTSSGKTEIYIHIIEDQLKKGKQVLYMLPEIALTAQIIDRLRLHFGNEVGVYHSRFSDAERAEIWKKVAEGEYRLIIGVRSSVLLPFNDLGLIVIDEEHDSSYKQQDTVPRYNARDTAIVLANIHKAKVLLGSASPSIESYFNARTGKYGLTELTERYGAIKMPEIVLANSAEAYRKKIMEYNFTPELINAIGGALSRKEQVILFQNRRGFSPYIECPECGWIPRCDNCSVSLTYHKNINKLVCHYCGKSIDVPSRCGSCGHIGMRTKGFGTEKIEEEIKVIFPDAVVGRMDQDTTRGKNRFKRIIKDFEAGKIDILTGTQMISKGLDFENLTVVGVLNADNSLHFPDFRSYERSFQLLEQVSGRAGRRKTQGKVIIQTSDPANPIIRQVVNHDYYGMFVSQINERREYNYPPYCRLVRIDLKHRNLGTLNSFAEMLANELRGYFEFTKVLGPEPPLVSKIQLWHISSILVKLNNDGNLQKSKKKIETAIENLGKHSGASMLRVVVDVDPY